MCLLINFTSRSVNREIWVKPRGTDSYNDILNWTPHDWYVNIHMSQQTFNHTCDQLAPLIQKRTTRLGMTRLPTGTGNLTLWRLATNIEFRTLSSFRD